MCVFFFKQKTAYEMRISDWSSDVCSSDLDEYHDGYPDTPGSGLRDNAYTNVLAAWVCARAVYTLAELAGHAGDEVRDTLDITTDQLERWEQPSRRPPVSIHDDGLIIQFYTYPDIAAFDWDQHRATYDNTCRPPPILTPTVHPPPPTHTTQPPA